MNKEKEITLEEYVDRMLEDTAMFIASHYKHVHGELPYGMYKDNLEKIKPLMHPLVLELMEPKIEIVKG